MATSKQTGKNLEKAIADILGLTRISVTNLGLKSCDLLGELNFKSKTWFVAGECKLRGAFTNLIDDAINQAADNSDDRFTPIAFIKRKYDSYDDTIVAMKLKDFRKLIK